MVVAGLKVNDLQVTLAGKGTNKISKISCANGKRKKMKQPYKPSAFESEIHPSHKILRFYALKGLHFALAGGFLFYLNIKI